MVSVKTTMLKNMWRKKLIQMQGKKDNSKITVWDFPFSKINKMPGWKISKDTEKHKQHYQPKGSNWYLKKIPLRNRRRHSLFKQPWMHAKMDHFMGYKTNLNKLKRTEVIQSVFTNHSGIKLEINNRKIMERLNS